MMDIKQEDGMKATNGMHEGGKNIKSEMKQEIKTEVMDDMDIKEEVGVKDEPTASENGSESTAPITQMDVMQSSTQQRRCSKCMLVIFLNVTDASLNFVICALCSFQITNHLCAKFGISTEMVFFCHSL